MNSLEEIKATIDHAIQTLELSRTCLAFEIPVYGFLTRTEAIYFFIYHTQRHIQQLKNISRSFDKQFLN